MTQLAPAVLDAAREYRKGVAAELASAEEQALIARRYAEIAFAPVSPVRAPAGGVQGVVCHSCGATSRFAVGAMLASCAHCGASLLANSETRARGLGQAALATRAARLAALQSERYFATRLARKTRVMSWLVPVNVVAVPAIAALLFSLSSLPDAETQALGCAAASVLALLVVSALGLWRRSLQQRADNALREVVLRHAGREIRGVEGLAAWMNAHWSDRYHVYDLSGAFRCRAAACELEGYPVLVIVNPIPAAGEPFIDLLLSAWYDGRSEFGNGPAAKGDPDARRALEGRGFGLQSGPSGIQARIRGEACRRSLKEGIDFGAALETLTRIAASQGGRPEASLG